MLPMDQNIETTSLTLGGVQVKVDIADTPEKQLQGLMGVEFLEEQHGKLFVFEHEDVATIHMQGMKIPIDTIWIDSCGMVRKVDRDLVPDSGKVISSLYPVKFILEIGAGFSDKFDIRPGDSVIFEKPEWNYDLLDAECRSIMQSLKQVFDTLPPDIFLDMLQVFGETDSGCAIYAGNIDGSIQKFGHSTLTPSISHNVAIAERAAGSDGLTFEEIKILPIPASAVDSTSEAPTLRCLLIAQEEAGLWFGVGRLLRYDRSS